jgi:uncharacterized membrane protein YgcG
MKRGRIAAALTVGLGFVLTSPVLVLADDGFGTRQADRHVYDNAAVLALAELDTLEKQAAGMDQVGAPTVVYLRFKGADTATTQQDARDLMDAWRVESSPGARDGLVLLLNLKPDDRRHGSAALVAGAHHVNDGRLNVDRLQAIYDNQMKPRLVAGDLAGAISSALDKAAADLRQPRSATKSDEELSRVEIGVAMAVILVAVLGLVGLAWALAVWLNRILSRPRLPGRTWTQRASGSSWNPMEASDLGGSPSGDAGGGTSSGSDSRGGSF